MAVKPTVLLYNFTDKGRRNRVNAYCVMHGIQAKTVEKSCYGKPILMLADREAEALFEGTGFPEGSDGSGEEKEISQEMLVMCGLGSQMEPFLAYLRREKIIVGLKAVLTPTNQFWNSLELYEELSREHEQMKEFRQTGSGRPLQRSDTADR